MSFDSAGKVKVEPTDDSMQVDSAVRGKDALDNDQSGGNGGFASKKRTADAIPPPSELARNKRVILDPSSKKTYQDPGKLFLVRKFIVLILACYIAFSVHKSGGKSFVC